MALYDTGKHKQIPLYDARSPTRLGCVEDRPEDLVHRQAAEEIHYSLTGERIRAEQRNNFPGRRSDDHRGWIAAIVIALLACMALAVPQEWKLDPPHTVAACR